MRILFVYLTLSTACIFGALIASLRYDASTAAILIVTVVALAAPVWIYTGFRVAKGIASLDIFSPLLAYPAAYSCWFILGSIDFVELPSTISFGAFDPIPAVVLYCAALGLVAYFLGITWNGRRQIAGPAKSLPNISFAWVDREFRQVVTVLMIGMTGAYAYIVAFLGIPILHLSALAEERPDLNNIPLYHWVATPFFAAAFTVSFLLLSRIFTTSGPLFAKRNRPHILGVLFVLLLLLSLAARAYVVPLLITGIVLYHYVRQPLTIKRFAGLLLAIFIALSVFGFARDLAGADSDAGISEWLRTAGVPGFVQPFIYVGLYFRYTVATFRDVIQIIPAQVPYQYGAITSLPLQSVLPGHHEMSDFYFKHLLGNEFVGQGQPATVLGPFYADFGVVGIFVGMLGWGVLLTALYRWMLRDRTTYSAMIFAWTTQAGLFGLFGGMFGYLDTLLVPLSWVVLHAYMRPHNVTRHGLGDLPAAVTQ